MIANIYLNFPGTTEAAFRFYEKALGVQIDQIVRFKDMPMPGFQLPKEAEDKVMHLALRINDQNLIMGSDTLESMGQTHVVGNNASVSIHPDSKTEADRIFHALADGGKVTMPINDAPWGDYFGMLTDRFGINWMVNFSYPSEAERREAAERGMKALAQAPA